MRMIIDDVSGHTVLLSPYGTFHVQTDDGNFVENRHAHTGYDAMMNDTASATSVLRAMNDDMFVHLAPVVAFLALLMAVGTMGNLAVCYIFGFKLGASTQNFLLLSIGVFDLLSCSLGIPAEFLDIRHFFLFESEEFCKIMRFCTTFPTLGSIQVLLVIAADRYRKVCRPLHGQIELNHARLALVGIVIIDIVFSVPALYLYGHRTFPTGVPGVTGKECSINDKYAGGRYPIVYQTTLGGAFVICTIALSVIYLKIWRETKRHKEYLKAHTMPGDSRQGDPSSSEDEGGDTEGGARNSWCGRKSALCRHVSNFNLLSRGRRRSVGSVENGNEQLNGEQTTFLNMENSQSQAENGEPRSTMVATDAVGSDSKEESLQIMEVKRGVDVVQDKSSGKNAEVHELHDLNENVRVMESVYRSIAVDSDLENDIQNAEFRNVDNDVYKEKQPKIKRSLSLPDIRLDDVETNSLRAVARRTCGSEYLKNPVFTVASSEANDTINKHKSMNQNSELSQHFFAIHPDLHAQETKTLFSKDDSISEDELNNEQTNFRYKNKRNKKSGSVRSDRKDNSQFQHEASFSDSNSSLTSQLSASAFDSHSVERRPLNPLSKSKRGRGVGSKNMKRVKSNPLFLQASNNLYKSRSHHSTRTSELLESRMRSQSDPPKSVYNSKYRQSQNLGRLSKLKSRSSQSLAVRRVKKAFRATRMTVIACVITLMFVLSFLPHISLSILRSVWTAFEHQLDGASLVLYNIFLRSYFVNTATNVFVYGTMNREFREEVNKIWRSVKLACCRQKQTPQI